MADHREGQEHRDDAGDDAAALELAPQRRFLFALQRREPLPLGRDRRLGISDDFGIELGAPLRQHVLGLGEAPARRQQVIAVLVVAFPIGCVALQAPAHNQEIAMLRDQLGEARPMREQRLVGQAQRHAGVDAVGDHQPPRHQAVGHVDLTRIGQRGAPHRARGRGAGDLVDLDQRQQQRRQRRGQIGRQAFDQRFGMSRDRALEAAQRLIAAIGQQVAAAGQHVAAVELVEHEREQRQRCRVARGSFADHRGEADPGVAVDLERQSRHFGGAGDDLLDLGGAGRGEMILPQSLRQRRDLRHLHQPVEEIAAHGGDDPDQPAAGQFRQPRVERAQRLGGKGGGGEQHLHLVEHQQQAALAHALGRRVRILGRRAGEGEAHRHHGELAAAAQLRRDFRFAIADRRQFRQRALAQQRRGEAREWVGRQVGRADHDLAPGRHPGHDARRHHVGQQPGPHQRRFAGAAGAKHQDEGGTRRGAGAGAAHQRLGDLAFGALTAEKHGGVLTVERLQAEIRRARPPLDPRAAHRRRGARALRRQAPAQQFAEMLLQLRFELVERLKPVERRLEAAVGRLEIVLPEGL